MPSINLRLSDEEHAALERWAKDGHRSLQKEIVFRLFSELGEPGPEPSRRVVAEVAEIRGDALGRDGHSSRPRAPVGAGLYKETTHEVESPRSPSSGCPMQPARGTKCKACGKVHPL